MSQVAQSTARLLALAGGRAIPIRSVYALAPDPWASFAIVPLRMVAEQVVYAIAYGDPDGEPAVVLTPNPQDRNATFLEPFADALDTYLATMVDAGQLPRVWLPHGAALEVVELLGHRFRANKNAGPRLQRMGRLCRVLAEEATYAGQQMVAVASEQLSGHVVTGQSPSEDRHLASLLAWIDPPSGVPVTEGPTALLDRPRAAAEAALEPAAAMLSREVDDRVEQLNARVRDRTLSRHAATAEIEPLLRAEALREWRLLTRARRAFWSLGLGYNELIGGLVNESKNRVAWYIAPPDGQPAARRGSIAARLDEQVYAQELAEYVDAEGDRVARGEAMRAGRVIRGWILERLQPRPGYHPCTIRVVAEQEVLRVRRGTQLQLHGSKLKGRIEAVTNDDGRVVLTLAVQSGVRAAAQLDRGDATEWSEPAPADLRISKRMIYKRMAETNDDRVYGTSLSAGSPLQLDTDLLTVAKNLRK